jgi:hypothetical protein
LARDYASVEAAKQKRINKETTSKVYNLPPGYIKGFKLSLENNQLKVGKGILSHRGNRMEKTTDYILNWEDYVGTTVVRNCTYYIYLCDDGLYKIDVIGPAYSDIHFGWYHTYFANYYYLGRFYFTTDGQYQYLVSGDAINLYDVPTATITIDRMYTDFLQSLFLQATLVVIGYHTNGTGTYASPEEGDTMMYLSGNTILRAERISATWVQKMVLGTLSAGAFVAVLGACVLCHPSNPPSSYEVLPNPNYRVFGFNNDYEDQFGVDDWDVKLNTAFDSSVKKFGIYSLTGTEGDNTSLKQVATGDPNEPQTAGVWVYINITNGEGNAAQEFNVIGFMKDSSNYVDIKVVKTASSNSYRFKMSYYAIGAEIESYTDTESHTGAAWYYLGLMEAPVGTGTTNITSVFDYRINITAVEISPYSGNLYLFACPAYNVNVAGTIYNCRMDELLFYYNKSLDMNLLAAHYTHNVAWETSHSDADTYIRPNTDGRIYGTGNYVTDGTFGEAGKYAEIPMQSVDSAALDVSQVQTLAHGLASIPKRVHVSLLCISAEAGYSVNDEIFLPLTDYSSRIGFAVVADATNFTTLTDINAIIQLAKNTTTPTTLTMSKWKFRIRYGL